MATGFNPLLAHVKIPGRVFQLPSKGLFYKKGEVLSDHIHEGEIEVKPMSALAEMKLRSADLLYTGKIIRELCLECVPDIIQPEKLLTKDVDALFAFLRLVTYGSELHINSIHTCKKAEIHSYIVDLESQLFNPNNEMLKNRDLLYRIELNNGQIVHTRPATYADAMQVVYLKHNVAKLEAKDEKPSDELLQEIFLTDMAAVIDSVEVPGDPPVIVTDREHIMEWLKSITKPTLNEIYKGMKATQEWGFVFKTELTCKDCGQKYTHDLELDPISFFYG
jgi:hypothetical protein